MKSQKFRMLEFYGRFLGLTLGDLQNIKRFMRPANDDELLEILNVMCINRVLGGRK